MAPRLLRNTENALSIIISLVPGKLTPRCQTYYAFLGDERIVTSRDPEPAVCRELSKRGYSGRVEFYWGERPGLIVGDLDQFAKMTTRDNRSQGPVMVKFQSNPFAQTSIPALTLGI